MKYNVIRVVDVSEWDKLVVETYGREYSFQQQNGCRERGIVYFAIPEHDDGYGGTASLQEWLNRDPVNDDTTDWEREFYPSLAELANDLHAKGLLEAGQYAIDVDW